VIAVAISFAFFSFLHECTVEDFDSGAGLEDDWIRQRLGFALAGIAEVWRREKSFRTQSAIAAAAVLVASAGAAVVGLLMIVTWLTS
jgi:diacylglycerol kinase